MSISLKFNKNECNNKYKMINIIISQFYEGCVVYRNKISLVHPLMKIILNLKYNIIHTNTKRITTDTTI